jgi:hypothetical protein
VLAWRRGRRAHGRAAGAAGRRRRCAPWSTLGLQHEQQHQELILTDLKHLLSSNPLRPAYQPAWPLARWPRWRPAGCRRRVDGGLARQGPRGPGFAFDNETPRHDHWLRPYALANRLVTHGDWADFVADGGYRDPRWWLSAGWDWVRGPGH